MITMGAILVLDPRRAARAAMMMVGDGTLLLRLQAAIGDIMTTMMMAMMLGLGLRRATRAVIRVTIVTVTAGAAGAGSPKAAMRRGTLGAIAARTHRSTGATN